MDKVNSDRNRDELAPRSWRRFAFSLIPVLIAAIVHFGFTVPRGPFEGEPKRRVESEWEALLSQWNKHTFGAEPRVVRYASAMEKRVRTAVSLARTKAIKELRLQTWIEAQSVGCHATRCRFSMCGERAMVDAMTNWLEDATWGSHPMWSLQTMPSTQDGCARLEVAFLVDPSTETILRLD